MRTREPELALKRVQEQRGPGIDGMTVDDAGLLTEHWPTIREQLLEGTYKPQPVKRVEIPKPEAGSASSGSLCRRQVHPASLAPGTPTPMGPDVLRPQLRLPTGTIGASGHRPRPSVTWPKATLSCDIDLEKFFDRVNHDRLMARVAKRMADKRVLKLLRAFLNAGVMIAGSSSGSIGYTPRGSTFAFALQPGARRPGQGIRNGVAIGSADMRMTATSTFAARERAKG